MEKKKMKIKNIITFILLAQLIIGCCDTNTYEVTISGLESRALIFDGNNPVEIDEKSPIDKEDLVIELLITELESIASSEQIKTDVKVLKAAVVPCGDDEFIYSNKIESVKVEILNLNNNERIDITNQLVVLGTAESISEYIPSNSPGTRDYLMKLSDTSNIPNQIDYLIEATLNDGSKISSTGGTINFN
jgi:hypothetical protein